MHQRWFILLFLIISSAFLFGQKESTADSLHLAGISKARKGNYTEALADFNRVKNIYESLDSIDVKVARAYNFIGHIYRRTAKHDEALKYYEQAKATLLKAPKIDTIELNNTYSGMGSSFRYIREYKRSLDYYLKAIELSKTKFGDTNYRVGFLYNNIGNTYDDSNDYENSLKYYTLSKDILENVFANNDENLSNIYNNYGDVLLKLKRYDEAQHYAEKSISLQESENNRSPHLIIGLQLLGDIALEQGLFDKAIQYYQQGLAKAGLTDINSNDFSLINSPEDCLIILAGLARTYSSQYEKSKDNAFLEKGKQVINTADKLIENLKEEFKETAERSVLLNNSFAIYENAIALAINENPQSTEAFSYSERSRTNLLREAVQDAAAKKFAGIPNDLIAQELKIKKELAELKRLKIEAENSPNADKDKDASNLLNIVKLKEKRQELIDLFEQEYPDYFSLKYNGNPIGIELIQKEMLQQDQAFLEYFVGSDNIFAFIITPTEYKVHKIANNFSLVDTVIALRKSVTEWRPRDSTTQTNTETYNRTASFLYDKLLRPIENDLPKKLVIVPGGILGYLPFEALLTKKVNTETEMYDYPYLIKEKQVSYSYSAALLNEMLKNKNTGSEVLAFAPKFGVPQDSLPFSLPYLKGLNHNEEEVSTIQKSLGGRVFKGKEATLQNFVEIAPLYKILHLATHGKASTQSNDFSYLAFTYKLDTLDNELLYAADLYNMELRADMVVLSACETGIGKLQQGEGIISLARGFSYAGAKSIVTTLWSVDDKSSLKIMANFYRNLENGYRKDDALRQAKLDFVKSNKNRAHPLFWAAYVPIGNMESIVIGRGKSWYYILGGAGLILLLFFIWWRRR